MSERRQHPRSECQHPVKLQTGAGGRYFGGRLRNLSAGGALIQLTGPARVIVGDRLRVGIAGEHTGVLVADRLTAATVVRAFDLPTGRCLGIRFDQPQTAAAPALAA